MNNYSEYPFRVYDKRGKLKDGIVAAFLQTFIITKQEYLARVVRTARGNFTIQGNPELDHALARASSVQVICSFQVRDACRVAVCRIKDTREL
jgi:hypothetical protein